MVVVHFELCYNKTMLKAPIQCLEEKIMKKILAALAASAMALSMMGVSAMAEGLDGEGDVIDDETVEDIVDETEPEVVETEPEPEVVETEAAPVETAPSPATGNSPVAMAVIPVALAAAAIVAKKAK